MGQEQILKEIIDYYLNSSDFNGLPIYQMENYDYKILCELIDEQLICVVLHFNGEFWLFTGLLYTTFQRYSHSHDITTRRTAAI